MEASSRDQYLSFRSLCLKNAEDFLVSAENLLEKNVNHIVYNLVVLTLEEIGKIFIAWVQMNSKEEWGKQKFNIPIDDYVKKLFWSIWGPTFTHEPITQGQFDKIKNLASVLHERCLLLLYTNLNDTLHYLRHRK